MNRVEKIIKKFWILIYTAGFLIISFGGYQVFFKERISFVFNQDGIIQFYVPFLYIGEYLRRFFSGLPNGEFILPTYDLSIFAGENIISSLNFYGFGDPLNLFSVIVTKENGPYLFTCAVFLRRWLSGLAFQLYCRYMKINPWASILGALGYTFCGYSINYGSFFIEFLPVMIFLPLMLIGVEKIIKGQKFSKTLIFGVMFGGMCCYYFLYMCSLFLAVYVVVRTMFKYERRYNVLFEKCLKCLRSYLIGICLSAPILVPSIMGYLGSMRSGRVGILDIILDYHNYIPSKKLLMYLFYMPFDATVTVGQTFSGVLSCEILIILLGMIVLPKNARKRQIVLGLGFTLLFSLLPISNYIFNSFGACYDRWLFIVHFVFGVAFSAFFSDLIRYFQVKEYADKIKSHVVKAIVLSMAGIIIWNVVVNIRILYSSADMKMYFLKYEDVDRYIESPITLSKSVMEDEEFFRVSNTPIISEITDQPENLAMLNNYYGLTSLYNTVNKYSQRFVDVLSGEEWNWRSHGLVHVNYQKVLNERGHVKNFELEAEGTDPSIEAAAGVKYFFAKQNEKVNDEYEYLETVDFYGEKWNIYKNPYYKGMVYVRDISSKELEEVDDYSNHYKKIFTSVKKENVSDVKYDNEKNTLECSVEIETFGQEVIISIPFYSFWNAYVDGKKIEIDKTDIMCMAIRELTPGTHSLKLTYVPYDFIAGLVIMGVGIISVILLQIEKRRRFANNPFKEVITEQHGE